MKKMSRKFFRGIVTAVVAISVSSSSGVGMAAEQSTIYCNDTSCSKVKLTVADTLSLYKDKTKTLKVSCDNSVDYKVSYKSSDKKIATVTFDGKIKGIAKGTATITTVVSGEHLKDDCTFMTTVTVLQPSIKISCSKKKLAVGKKVKVKVIKTGISKTVKWSVSNKKIASISKSGELKGKKIGTVKVYAICGDLKKSIKIRIVAK